MNGRLSVAGLMMMGVFGSSGCAPPDIRNRDVISADLSGRLGEHELSRAAESHLLESDADPTFAELTVDQHPGDSDVQVSVVFDEGLDVVVDGIEGSWASILPDVRRRSGSESWGPWRAGRIVDVDVVLDGTEDIDELRWIGRREHLDITLVVDFGPSWEWGPTTEVSSVQTPSVPASPDTRVEIRVHYDRDVGRRRPPPRDWEC